LSDITALSNTTRPTMQDWEDQVNALLDGELGSDDADGLILAAESDAVIARAIVEAYQLQKILAALPAERAPASLRNKLKAIPRQNEAGWPWFPLEPRWAVAALLFPLVLVLGSVLTSNEEPTAAQIAQGKQDLNLALVYLRKTTRKTSVTIESVMSEGFGEPVTGKASAVVRQQLQLNREHRI
jgi:hypothetical protein